MACRQIWLHASAVCVMLMLLFCTASAVLLALWFDVLLIMGWHLLLEAIAGTAVHGG
jgi:hypothetical protein